MEARISIGEQIRSIRLARNISLAELADMAGVKELTISKIESGKFSASVELLTQILEPLDAELVVKMREGMEKLDYEIISVDEGSDSHYENLYKDYYAPLPEDYDDNNVKKYCIELKGRAADVLGTMMYVYEDDDFFITENGSFFHKYDAPTLDDVIRWMYNDELDNI